RPRHVLPAVSGRPRLVHVVCPLVGCSSYSRGMATAREARRWHELFAARTRGDVGEGIAAVLAFLGVPDVISFAGGFPDPLTFPRERAAALLAEFAATGEASAFQYAPTR